MINSTKQFLLRRKMRIYGKIARTASIKIKSCNVCGYCLIVAKFQRKITYNIFNCNDEIKPIFQHIIANSNQYSEVPYTLQIGIVM
jgi:hypothetical protein